MENVISVEKKKGHFCLYIKYENKCIRTQHLTEKPREQSPALL